MDYQRLYEYRFRDVDQREREAVWGPIARFVHEQLGRPRRVLDPAAGRCEFINSVPADERWAVDRVAFEEASRRPGIRFVLGDAMDVEFPDAHFDAIEEHLYAAGLEPVRSIPRFLPHSLRGRLPASKSLAGAYLRMPPVWRVLGKQYLVVAER